MRHARLVARFPGQRHRSRHLTYHLGPCPPPSPSGPVPRASSSRPRAWRHLPLPISAAWPTSSNPGHYLARIATPSISPALRPLRPRLALPVLAAWQTSSNPGHSLARLTPPSTSPGPLPLQAPSSTTYDPTLGPLPHRAACGRLDRPHPGPTPYDLQPPCSARQIHFPPCKLATTSSTDSSHPTFTGL
jgi:hypothetical protein